MSESITAKRRALFRSDLPADPIALARYLIGVTLVRRIGRHIMSGRIVETEAYLPDDPASHGFNGRTKRNASVFTERGHAYVYRIYGAWWCFNVSAGKADEGAAVLIRACEPLLGITAMRRRRPRTAPKDLLRGPGRLCEALAIDQSLDGVDLTRDNAIWLAERHRPQAIGESVRIGLSKAEDLVLRFYERGSVYLSGAARLNQ